MRHIIWRNRASAILGIFVMLIPFTGFPEVIRDSLIVLSGFLIALFGFYHGSSNYALVEESISVNTGNRDEASSVEIEKKAKTRHIKKEEPTHDEPSPSLS